MELRRYRTVSRFTEAASLLKSQVSMKTQDKEQGGEEADVPSVVIIAVNVQDLLALDT